MPVFFGRGYIASYFTTNKNLSYKCIVTMEIYYAALYSIIEIEYACLGYTSKLSHWYDLI